MYSHLEFGAGATNLDFLSREAVELELDDLAVVLRLSRRERELHLHGVAGSDDLRVEVVVQDVVRLVNALRAARSTKYATTANR